MGARKEQALNAEQEARAVASPLSDHYKVFLPLSRIFSLFFLL
jgi:hypothetical protein